MKPWRLFLLICGLPSLMCATILIFFIPESPKFTFSQGDEAETLKILQRIHQMNTGLPAHKFEVTGIIKDSEFGDIEKQKENFFKFMWSQSVPLFKGSHLRNILTACFIQFSVFNASNGFWTFLPEILNKVSLWNERSRGPATICEIFHSNEFLIQNQTEEVSICKPVEKLELSTFIYIYEIMLMYAVCYYLMSLTINRAGKLVIILTATIPCGAIAFLLIFIKVPQLLSYLYIIMIIVGLCASVVNASTVELYPTKMRLVTSKFFFRFNF